jgi:hypothetical protein
MRGRFISREAIVNSFKNYEIIEEYPDDKYLPSYLVCSHFQEKNISCVVRSGRGKQKCTGSYSLLSLEGWDDSFKKRRSRL